VLGRMIRKVCSAARLSGWIGLALAAAMGAQMVQAQEPNEQRLVDLANEARADAGLPPLTWDAALAAAARAHAELMARASSISHQYDGEPGLPQRAAAAGAHFSLIEENIAMGYSPGQIHDGWMHSQGHHDNLLNPKVNRIGVALVSARGMLFAVADYSQSVQSLSQEQVEAKVGAVVQGHGLALMTDVSGARRYCALDQGDSGAELGLKARFLMRWQNADITKLPPQLVQAMGSGQFKQAAVGACEPKGGGRLGGPVFSGYRVAVLLY
jgi:hypothetical protein